MYDDCHEEFYEGPEPEHDIEDLNKVTRLQKYNSMTITTGKYERVFEPMKIYENLKKIFDNQEASTSPSEEVSESISSKTSDTDSNPVSRFLRLKSEIDLIEKDMIFYAEHKELYKSEVPYETCLDELNKLKLLVEYIDTSGDYSKLKKIFETQTKNGTSMNSSHLNLLNKKLYDRLDEALIERMKNINQMKKEDLNKDFFYEIFVTPKTEKVKEFSRIIEIKHIINNIEKKIGFWSYKSKKKSLASAVINVRDNIRLFDQNFKEEIQSKIDVLNQRIEEIKNNNEEFYKNNIDKEKLDDLYNRFQSSKDVEDTIYNIISRMESLKNEHEESAYISLKVKELIDQQKKVYKELNDDNKILNFLNENINNNIEVINKNIAIIQNKLK